MSRPIDGFRVFSIAKALGIDPNMVRHVSLSADYRDVVEVTITVLADERLMAVIRETEFRRAEPDTVQESEKGECSGKPPAEVCGV